MADSSAARNAAGVSVVQLYAGAFFPGLMLAGLYILYVIIIAKLKPSMAPPLSMAERYVPLPPLTEKIAPSHGTRALPGLLMALKGSRNQGVPTGYILRQLFIVLLPALLFVFVALWSYRSVTTVVVEEVSTMTRIGDCSLVGQSSQPDGRSAALQAWRT